MDWRLTAKRIRVRLGFGFTLFYVLWARPTLPWFLAGALLVALGLAIRAFASGHVVKLHELTLTGPYAYTRHPLYLGSVVMAGGFALAARSLWIVIGMMVMFFAIYLPVMRIEEYYLRRGYGEQYDEYARNVPMLLPRLTPFRRGGSFSRALYWQHREYNALLGAAFLMAILVVKMVRFAR